MPAPTPTARMATCHPKRRHYARGLCKPCYECGHNHGTLDKHPRTRRTAAEFAEDYTTLRLRGLTRNEIAAKLSISRNAIDLAYSRAVRAGRITPDRRRA